MRELNSYVSPLGLEAIIYEYTNWGAPNDSTAMIKALDKMVGDYQFTCPTLEMAQRLVGPTELSQSRTTCCILLSLQLR